MSKLIFKLNSEGVQNLLKSAEMQAVLNEHVSNTLGSLPEGYDGYVKVHKKRAVGYVFPASPEAKQDNLENNTILKAVQ